MENQVPRKPGLDDIGSYIKSRCLGRTIIRDILATKGAEVWKVSSGTIAFEALELMEKKNIGALVVVDDGNVVGMFSERDYARKIILFDKSSRDTRVGEIMSSPVQVVSSEDSVRECMSLMSAGHVRHFPVCDGEQLVGMVSLGDLVKSFVSNQQRLILEYEQYIQGGSSDA